MAMIDRRPRSLLRLIVILLICSCATTRRAAPEKTKHTPDYITFVAVGDNLIHEEIIQDAKTRGYDFNDYYTEVADFIRSADLAFINQETLISGGKFGISGYPRFNGPKEIGDAIVNAGFDVVNHATNHVMDKGEDAVFEVLDYWEQHPGITVLGIHRSAEERNKAALVNVKGITFGFLSYTYGLNGFELPAGNPDLVSLIDKEKIAWEVDALRPLCDFLVVSMHWGDEYEYKPNKSQETLAALLAGHNVDLVIGHHPHVLQPVRVFRKPDGGRMYCYFSLGNFFSSQDKNERLLGAMLYIRMKVTDDNPDTGNAKTLSGKTLAITEASLLPIVTHYEKGPKGYKVYFLKNYTGALAGLHGLNSSKNKVSPAYWASLITQIFGGIMVPEP